MYKLFVALLMTLYLGIGGVLAQSPSVSGTLIDETGEPLIGANILLFDEKDSVQIVGIATDTIGNFRINVTEPGSYLLKISYLGYLDFKNTISIGNEARDLGKITLRRDDKVLEEVTVAVKAASAVLKGDTVEYNARAYKVNPDAVAEDLVTKMPGVTVDKGQVKVQGEDVKKVLIDGKEFFGDDANIALKNLPADIVDRIQFFDRSSDQAEFTGFRDSETTKAINIKTKGGKSNGKFGRLTAGYGSNNRFLVGGNMNFFKGKRRITILGLSNNINQQNFSTEDLTGLFSGSGGGRRWGRGGGFRGGDQGPTANFLVGQNNGINTNHSFGINYTDVWGKKWNVTGSYFFNNTINKMAAQTARTYFLPDTAGQLYRETASSESNSVNHRFNMRMEYTIDSSNALTFTPSVSLQTSSSESTADASTRSAFEKLFNTNSNHNSGDLTGYSISGSLLYRHKFNMPRRTLSLNLTGRTNNTDGINTLYSNAAYFGEKDTVDITDQHTDIFNDSYTISSELNYTEPLGKNAQLLLTYTPAYTNSRADRETNRLDDMTKTYSLLDTVRTSKYDFTVMTQRAGASYRLAFGNIDFSAGFDAQSSLLRGQQSFPIAAETRKHFNNLLPRVLFRYTLGRRTALRLNYSMSTQVPSVTQLQDVIDNSNPLNIVQGNPNLDQEYTHSLRAFFRTVDSTLTKSLIVFINGSLSENYITNSALTATKDTVLQNGATLFSGAQLTRAVNLRGYRSFRSFVTYGVPVTLLKCNLNANAGYTYSRLPGQINSILNYANTHTLSGGIDVGSNISQNIDFRLSYTANYNLVRNTFRKSADQNYYSGNASVRTNIIFLKHLAISSDFNLVHYNGLGEGFNVPISLWNVAIGYKFLKNNAAELRLSVYDLLNQNNSIQRNVTNAYFEDIQTNILRRYFMFNFTYNLRNFKG